MIKSLRASGNPLSDTREQIKILNNFPFNNGALPFFKDKIKEHGELPLKPTGIEIFQVNVGYLCNQTCKHCHVDAGPDRKEVMDKAHLQMCLDVLDKNHIKTLDITGGAPELNPDFRWFVEEAAKTHVEEIIVRSNLTVILANKKYYDLPDFFKDHRVRVISSLPYYQAKKTDRQRGEGVFDKSIKVLKMLNEEGYGRQDSGLVLDLVYNPTGAFLPGKQEQLEQDFKRELNRNFNIEFNSLFTITNLPISRFLDFLIVSGNYEEYMHKLVSSFNPAAVKGVMCRNTISVDWDGSLYDCDFNQMLNLKVEKSAPDHIRDFNLEKLNNRKIVVNQHCYGCTAGAGSSCQGTVA